MVDIHKLAAEIRQSEIRKENTSLVKMYCCSLRRTIANGNDKIKSNNFLVCLHQSVSDLYNIEYAVTSTFSPLCIMPHTVQTFLGKMTLQIKEIQQE